MNENKITIYQNLHYTSPKGEIYSYKCLDKKTKFSNQQPSCTTKGTRKRRANETQRKMVERINETNFQGPKKLTSQLFHTRFFLTGI